MLAVDVIIGAFLYAFVRLMLMFFMSVALAGMWVAKGIAWIIQLLIGDHGSNTAASIILGILSFVFAVLWFMTSFAWPMAVASVACGAVAYQLTELD